MNKYVLSFIITILFSVDVFSQATNDAGLWATFNIEKKLNKKFGVFITEEYRRKENFTRTNLFYTDLGVFVKPLDFLKVSLAYRPIEKYMEDNTFSYRHRLMLDISVKKKFGKLTASFRERIQAEVRNVYSSEIGNIPEWYSRNKFELKYDLDKPVTPYIATEFRYQINNPRAVESNKLWHRGRFALGLDYKYNNRNTVGLYYLIQQEFNVSAPQNLYIVGIEYSLSL
ncbi:MAG: hypothetical protein A3F72_09535 [Bacteroidetes bacterium RIFCSPLOWO2_12_FULL_35_15]|nr:MAG: hypothetical protein A3F72_09535 [Bacteroidetes bacterium RIFCSPLOWO2_12_FULL_35_15]